MQNMAETGGLWDHLCAAGVDKDLPASVIEAAMKFERTNIMTAYKHDECKYYLLSIEDESHFSSSKTNSQQNSPLGTRYQPQKYHL
jgi:hypothetical protein